MNDKLRFSLPLFRGCAAGLTLAFGLAFPAIAQAQQGLPSKHTAPAPYLLGADDVINIQVINFPELCVPQITVPSDGKITVPVLGSLPVAGQTTAQVARTLTTRWSQFVVGPLVTVTLTQRRHQNVQVYGFVTHAQTVEYRPELRVMQALAEAGGAAENGDLAHVTVTHQGGDSQIADLSSAQTGGGSADDIVLAPNDIVFVPERHLQISVLGEVVKPGSYVYQDKMTVLDALKDADNINQGTADLNNATLLHAGTESTLDLNSLLVKGQLADNVALQPGDRIFIPTLHNRIFVDGAVGHPGYYAFKPGDRLVDAISGSGGTQAGLSDLKFVSVIHVDKLHNTATQQTIDLGKFYRGDMQANVALSPGDAIYVPIKGNHPKPLDILGGALGLATGFKVLGQ